jgi:hypothetical protein
MKTLKTALLSGIALIAFAGMAMSQQLTIGVGGSTANVGGTAASTSQSNSAAFLIGAAQGSTTGAAQTTGTAAGQNTIGNGSSTSLAQNQTTVLTQTNTTSAALGLAATANGSTAAGTGTSGATGFGNFFTIKAAP